MQTHNHTTTAHTEMLKLKFFLIIIAVFTLFSSLHWPFFVPIFFNITINISSWTVTF